MNDDLEENNVILDRSSDYGIEVVDGTFSHLRDAPPVLHDIYLQIKEGSLTAVVGSVGAGKSSLLSAITGDLHRQEGSITRKGSLALVSQEAFIVNASIRNNILFGEDYDEELYRQVIKDCGLDEDFETLPNGDRSVIGEKGINISGGQKQRISLARAVYSNADIYLLDDPLSAVDIHVGKHIFEHVIGPNGLLKDKTRLMVTHGMHWLPHMDEIYVIDNGRLSQLGAYNLSAANTAHYPKYIESYLRDDEAAQELLNNKNVLGKEKEHMDKLNNIQLPKYTLENFKEKRKSFNKNIKKEQEAGDSVSMTSRSQNGSEDDKDSDVFDEQEQVKMGNVSWSVYKAYLKAMGLKMVSICVLCMIGSTGLDLTYSIWISKWTGDEVFQNSSQASTEQRASAMEKYLIILSFIGLGQMLTVLSYTLLAAYCFCQASSNLHKSLLNNILKAKILFFEIKPLGMILNRFSKDVDIVDNTVGWSVLDVSSVLALLAASVGGIVYATPMFVLAIIPMAAFYIYIQRFYISTGRQLRRLSSKASSPIYAHLSETINGCQTIRAFGHQKRFMQENIDNIEKLNIYQYYKQSANIWLDVRMYFFSGLLIFLTALFCVISMEIPILHMSPSMVGLALSLVLQVTENLASIVWTASKLETDTVSVERIKEYAEVDTESDWTTDANPPSNWPSEGGIEFSNYSSHYCPELQLATDDISLTIKPQEKVGVVGRTGSDKFSLTLPLFRMLEAEKGSIKVDGVDISQLGLHRLRNSLTILPQDPVLFSGTLRENLDPFAESSDEKLWKVLEQCKLKKFVVEQPGQLSVECREGGKNLSVGQRQLVCLARALLRKTKILIMDEPTAAVDMKTDDFVQKTIKSKFSDCTVLTIAHRLHTIMDCDRILVISEGSVVEFDSPKNLLANQRSMFYTMAKDAGIVP
ncbi:ATP-binding cassette sub-family C member 2-like isoform X2 [Watersipora subatra]|uniref:ATP-binding cassette sub-family C member 2-like isoform X2 n=1 Tax=Watersipora subatra TaxID=2589382 RepID=UPI00355BFA52